MLDRLILNNFPSGTQPVVLGKDKSFCLKTCQRTLYLSLDPNHISDEANILEGREKLIGPDAYLFLLETICGLKSKLVGESEIVGQFKDAFSQFLNKEEKETDLIRILEKLFKDAKTIRSQYLLGLSQKTYASITRKFIINKHKAEKVLILGSGSLAEDLINQFKKKANVAICARNSMRLKELQKIHDLELVEWFDTKKIMEFSHIANTIGSNEIIFDSTFFNEWSNKFSNKLFVDLGSPSCVQPEYFSEEYVVNLNDIFNEGAIHESHKIQQIEKARQAMLDILTKRAHVLREHSLKREMYKLQETNFAH